MSAVSDILSSIPLDRLASELDTDPNTAEQAAREAISSLVGGMQSNLTDPSAEASLASALDEHAARGLLGGGQVDLGAIDTNDGAKIAQHILGANGVQQLGSVGGIDMNKVIKLLAPIVLGYLASQVTSGKYGNVLGSILGGGSQQTQQTQAQTQSSGGGIFGDILGGILGGGQQAETTTQQTSGGTFTGTTSGNSTSAFPADESTNQTTTTSQTQSSSSGSILGDILGGMFGR